MNYIDEYTEMLNTLKNGEKTKIDIHFVVSEPLKSFCVEVNQRMRKIDPGFIDMNIESIIIPHISLCMGFVDNHRMMEKVFSIVYDYSKSISSFVLDPDRLYFASISETAPQYLFVDSKQNDFLMLQKETLHNVLNDVIYPIGWNMKEECAHITIGCYKKTSPDLLEEVMQIKEIPSCKISQIAISLCGKRGVCLSALKTFDLD